MRFAAAFASGLLLAACAHDFGPFEPVPGNDEGGKDGGKKGHAAEDGPCTPSASCLGKATACAGDCRTTQTSCDSMCGGDMHCGFLCQMKAMECQGSCVTTCTSCAETAGCPASAECQAATAH